MSDYDNVACWRAWGEMPPVRPLCVGAHKLYEHLPGFCGTICRFYCARERSGWMVFQRNLQPGISQIQAGSSSWYMQIRVCKVTAIKKGGG